MFKAWQLKMWKFFCDSLIIMKCMFQRTIAQQKKPRKKRCIMKRQAAKDMQDKSDDVNFQLNMTDEIDCQLVEADAIDCEIKDNEVDQSRRNTKLLAYRKFVELCGSDVNTKFIEGLHKAYQERLRSMAECDDSSSDSNDETIADLRDDAKCKNCKSSKVDEAYLKLVIECFSETYGGPTQLSFNHHPSKQLHKLVSNVKIWKQKDIYSVL